MERVEKGSMLPNAGERAFHRSKKRDGTHILWVVKSVQGIQSQSGSHGLAFRFKQAI
jgi:hypothetical protein